MSTLFPERLRSPLDAAAEWLAVVRSDPRMADQGAALALAAAIAPFVEPSGAGEMPSLPDLAKASKLIEDEVIDALNQLIYRGFVALIFRPRIRFSLPFFIRPGPFQSAAIEKSAPR